MLLLFVLFFLLFLFSCVISLLLCVMLLCNLKLSHCVDTTYHLPMNVLSNKGLQCIIFKSIIFKSFQLLQGLGLGLNVPTGGTDQNTGSAIAVYLAMHGADINFFNHEGKTPLDLCADPQTANLIKQFARSAPR